MYFHHAGGVSSKKCPNFQKYSYLFYSITDLIYHFKHHRLGMQFHLLHQTISVFTILSMFIHIKSYSFYLKIARSSHRHFSPLPTTPLIFQNKFLSLWPLLYLYLFPKLFSISLPQPCPRKCPFS